jgi:hypothetical protein
MQDHTRTVDHSSVRKFRGSGEKEYGGIGTGVEDQATIGLSDIGKSEFLRLKETRDRKSRNPEGIETVHLGDRCRKSGTSRHIANRDIGDPEHKGFVHFEIAIREIPISGVQLSAQQRRRTED